MILDNIIVLAYLISLLLIGIIQRSKSNSFKGFANVNDKVKTGKILLVATIFASSVGGGTTFGLSEKAFAGNLAHSYGLFLSIPVDILIAIYLVPRLIEKHYGKETIGDIMATDYGSCGRILGGISAILVSIGMMAAQISVSGRIFEYILQIDYIKGVIFSYGIIVIYTTIGGLRSVLFTNQLQFFAMILAIPAISIFSIYQIGFDNFYQQIPLDKFSFANNEFLLSDTIAATLGFITMNLFPTFVQRILLNKEPKKTVEALYIKISIYGIFIIFITINGLVAHVIYPEIKSSLALPYLIDHIIPHGLQGLVVVGLLAAVMSTADSDLNITSVTLVKDLFNPIFNINNQQKMLLIARIVNVAIGSLAIIIALSFSSVVDLVIFISGFWGPVILVPLVFSLFNITISEKAMCLSSASGILAFCLWEYNHHFYEIFALKGVFVGTIASLVIFLITAKLEKINKT